MEVKKENNLERLCKKKFDGKALDWKPSQRLGPDFQWVEDNNAFYTNRKDTDIIYVQPKYPSDAKSTCYGCRSNILMKVEQVTEWDDSFGVGACAGGDVTREYARYRPKREKEPYIPKIRLV